MLNKCIMYCALTMMIAVSAPSAFAGSAIKPYIGVAIGTSLTSVNKLSDSSGSLKTYSDPGYAAGVAAGVGFDSWGILNMERIRVEAEAGYRTNELVRLKNSGGQSTNVNGTVSVANFMINGYVENSSMLSRDLPVTIFLTAGAGAAMASISSISYQGTTLATSSEDTQFAYQGGLGFGYDLTKKVTLDATYKYLGTTDFKFGGIKGAYGSHNVLVGARYQFN